MVKFQFSYLQAGTRVLYIRDGTGQDFLDQTGKFQNRQLLTGVWPAQSTVFLKKFFLHGSMHLMKNFQKGRHGWGVKICHYGRGAQKKTLKNFCCFCKNNSILKPFLIKFRFERLVLSSVKCAQYKLKKNWRAQTKLLEVFSNDMMR